MNQKKYEIDGKMAKWSHDGNVGRESLIVNGWRYYAVWIDDSWSIGERQGRCTWYPPFTNIQGCTVIGNYADGYEHED